MAKPIKETPILKGKDAQKFIEQHEKNLNSKGDKLEMARIMRHYNQIKEAAQQSDRYYSSQTL